MATADLVEPHGKQRPHQHEPGRERQRHIDGIQLVELVGQQAALQEARGAIARVTGNAEIEGLALPPVEDVGLAHPGVGERQHGVGAGARAAVHRAHPQDTTLFVGAQPDHGVPALEAEPVSGVGLDPIALQKT